MEDQAGAGTRYLAFGDVAVQRVVDGVPSLQPLRRRRERDTLAVLLAVRAPVSADRLLAEVWESGAALGSLQAVVSRLRDTLEPQRAARGENRCLVSTSAGYAVRAQVTDVDTWRFEDLAVRCVAAADPAAALPLFEQADELWVGTPYADCATDSVEAARARLVDLRASAAERAAQALLDLGRPEQVGLLLAGQSQEHPFRERLFALLALAHYRCGRQSEALATLRDLRARLADELGVDPTPEVRRLETDLLQHSPGLDGPAARPVERPAAPAPVDAPVEVPVVAQADAAVVSRRSAEPPDLLGREGPLALVDGLLGELPAGGLRLVSVLGEPGIGKTRFVQEVVRRAIERGIRCVTGQCHEASVAPALWPWTQVVRSLLTDDATTDPLLAPLVEGQDLPVDTGSGPMRLFETLARLLDATARAEGGLVVVLEDLHWADDTSLQLLAHVADRAATVHEAPVMVVTTRRTTEEHRSDQMVPTLAALARCGTERIRLGGLSRAEVAVVLAHQLGRSPDDLPAEVVMLVEEATAGNAFYVHEYARLLLTVDDLEAVGSLPVPDGVRDVIGQRVDRLPEEARHLLRVASVLGRVVDPRDAAALAGQSPAEALDHLDLALATGLLVEHEDRYAYAHVLTREALYAALSPARRVRLHARAAEVLADRCGSSPDSAADIAHHALLAAPLGEDHARTAFTWLARAARVSQSRQAPVEARHLWTQAREIAEQLGLEDERLHAMLGVAQCTVRMGMFSRAPRLVTELAEDASRLGHWDLVAQAAATFHLAGAWTWRGHGGLETRLIEVLTAALPHLEGADEAAVCGTLMVEHQFNWDHVTSDAYADRALRVARASGDHELLCAILALAVIAANGRPDLGARSPMVEQLLAEGPPPVTEATALFHLGYALHEEGRVEEAEQAMERAASLAQRLAHTGLDVPLAWWRWTVARDHDDPDVVGIGQEALRLHLSQRFFYGSSLQTLHAVLSTEPGQTIGEDVVRRAEQGIHAERALAAWSLVEAGRLDRAADVVGPAPPDRAADYSIPATLCLRVLVAAALGDLTEVAEMLRRVDRYTVPLAVYGTVDHLGAFDHFRAVAHRALGDPRRALVLARAAVETNRACDIRPWLRRSERLVTDLEQEVQLSG